MTDNQTIPGFDDHEAPLQALSDTVTDKRQVPFLWDILGPEAEADPEVEAHIASLDFDLEDLISASRDSFAAIGLTAVVHPDGIELWKISGTMKEFVVALSTDNILKAAAVLNKVK